MDLFSVTKSIARVVARSRFQLREKPNDLTSSDEFEEISGDRSLERITRRRNAYYAYSEKSSDIVRSFWEWGGGKQYDQVQNDFKCDNENNPNACGV